MIEGLSAQARARIQAAQPYHAGDEADKTLIWIVHELNIADKHRLIPVTTLYSFVGHLRMGQGERPPVDVVPAQEETGENLRDGMEIARVPIRAGTNLLDFDLRLGVDISFEEVAGVPRHPATSLLTKATDHVHALVESFAQEFGAG